ELHDAEAQKPAKPLEVDDRGVGARQPRIGVGQAVAALEDRPAVGAVCRHVDQKKTGRDTLGWREVVDVQAEEGKYSESAQEEPGDRGAESNPAAFARHRLARLCGQRRPRDGDQRAIRRALKDLMSACLRQVVLPHAEFSCSSSQDAGGDGGRSSPSSAGPWVRTQALMSCKDPSCGLATEEDEAMQPPNPVPPAFPPASSSAAGVPARSAPPVPEIRGAGVAEILGAAILLAALVAAQLWAAGAASLLTRHLWLDEVWTQSLVTDPDPRHAL